MTAQIVMHGSRKPQTKRYFNREWEGDHEWFGLDDFGDSIAPLWDRIAEGKRRDG
jgi:hypothetical protein